MSKNTFAKNSVEALASGLCKSSSFRRIWMQQMILGAVTRTSQIYFIFIFQFYPQGVTGNEAPHRLVECMPLKNTQMKKKVNLLLRA